MNHLRMNDYQEATAKTAIYPANNALPYLTLGLAAEAGEVADKVAKYYRGDKPLDPKALVAELGDVLWFVAQLSMIFGMPLEQVALQNLTKLNARKEAGTLQGDGDNR